MICAPHLEQSASVGAEHAIELLFAAAAAAAGGAPASSARHRLRRPPQVWQVILAVIAAWVRRSGPSPACSHASR
jgi:hypothetical protein